MGSQLRAMRRRIVMRRAEEGAKHIRPENAPGKFRRWTFKQSWEGTKYTPYSMNGPFAKTSVTDHIKEILNG